MLLQLLLLLLQKENAVLRTSKATSHVYDTTVKLYPIISHSPFSFLLLIMK